jgi:hypothetical protein
MKNVQRVGLQSNQITSNDARGLLLSPVSEQIQEIDLTENPIPPADKLSLAALADERRIRVVL